VELNKLFVSNNSVIGFIYGSFIREAASGDGLGYYRELNSGRRFTIDGEEIKEFTMESGKVKKT
jgi:hypothetical protein